MSTWEKNKERLPRVTSPRVAHSVMCNVLRSYASSEQGLALYPPQTHLGPPACAFLCIHANNLQAYSSLDICYLPDSSWRNCPQICKLKILWSSKRINSYIFFKCSFLLIFPKCSEYLTHRFWERNLPHFLVGHPTSVSKMSSIVWGVRPGQAHIRQNGVSSQSLPNVSQLSQFLWLPPAPPPNTHTQLSGPGCVASSYVETWKKAHRGSSWSFSGQPERALLDLASVSGSGVISLPESPAAQSLSGQLPPCCE